MQTKQSNTKGRKTILAYISELFGMNGVSSARSAFENLRGIDNNDENETNQSNQSNNSNKQSTTNIELKVVSSGKEESSDSEQSNNQNKQTQSQSQSQSPPQSPFVPRRKISKRDVNKGSSHMKNETFKNGLKKWGCFLAPHRIDFLISELDPHGHGFFSFDSFVKVIFFDETVMKHFEIDMIEARNRALEEEELEMEIEKQVRERLESELKQHKKQLLKKRKKTKQFAH